MLRPCSPRGSQSRSAAGSDGCGSARPRCSAREAPMFTIEFLAQIRAAEIDVVASSFPAGARILEIGAGTGQQALALRTRGFDVEPIEIAASNYKGGQLCPITDYDGRSIPYPCASFDVVYSSNV